MEKKIPERKVDMKESDLFYVYEKRINKCIKDGCEGIVKYGLNIKVKVNDEESINCFECNKCHMKYTPYPNYNRLSDKHLSAIYNQEQVDEWQEHTLKKVNSRNNPQQATGFKREGGMKRDGFRKDHFKAGYKKPDYKKNYQGQNGDEVKNNGDYADRKPYFKKNNRFSKEEGYQKREFVPRSTQREQGEAGGYRTRQQGEFQGRRNYRDFQERRNFKNREGFQNKRQFNNRSEQGDFKKDFQGNREKRYANGEYRKSDRPYNRDRKHFETKVFVGRRNPKPEEDTSKNEK